MEQKKYKTFTMSEIKFWAGFGPALALLLPCLILIALKLGTLDMEAGIRFLKLWIPLLLFACLVFFCIARGHSFFQKAYIKYVLGNIKFKRELFNDGKGPEDLQDMTTYDVPIQSLEKLLMELHVRPYAEKNELSPVIMQHDFLQKKERPKTMECRYESIFDDEIHDVDNHSAKKDPDMYLKIDFPDGDPKKACFVRCNCGCGQYRLYGADGKNLAIGIRSRESARGHIATFWTRNWINNEDDSRLREQLNELEFTEEETQPIVLDKKTGGRLVEPVEPFIGDGKSQGYNPAGFAGC